jgi:lipoyl-dependent peroxiredoxin
MAPRGMEWAEDVPRGTDALTGEVGGDRSHAFRSRFECELDSNPVQLIAAAHAACFSMVLSNMLAQAGRPFHSVETEVTMTLGPVDGALTITKIALVTVGRVPGLDELAFADHVLAARARCLVSRSLAGVPEITLEASLAL